MTVKQLGVIEGTMLHRVSAFATEARVVLGQEKVMDKSNEITAIPKLLELFDVKGHIVTIDAMGCQYAIADNIVSKEGDYIFSLKGNQENLSDDVTVFFNSPPHNTTLLSQIEHDKGHGRVETRVCVVCNDVQWLRERHPKWQTINSIMKIDATREFTNKEKNKTTQETRYFISSLKDTSAEIALKAIRDHL